MKENFLATILSILCFSCNAQSNSWKTAHKELRHNNRTDSLEYYIPYDNGDFVFTRVVEAGNLDKSELFSRALISVSNALSTKHGITEDKSTAIVIGNGIIQVPKTGELHNTPVSIAVECKDEKYRIKIYNIESEHAKEKGSYIWLYEKIVLKQEFVGEKKRRKKDLVQLYDEINKVMDGIERDMKSSDF